MLLGWPCWSDTGVLYTPTFDSGSWNGALPLTNLQDSRLAKVTRSTDATLPSTRFRVDLKTDRAVRIAAIPKTNLSAQGRVRFLGVPSTQYFNYEAGDDIAALGGTFTRPSTAGYIDRLGVYRTAANGAARDAHFINGLRYILLEAQSTNLVLQSENFGVTWTLSGTPTRVAAFHTASGVSLDLIGDDDGAVLESFAQNITFTADAVKSIKAHVRAGGSSTSSVIRLRDTTAGADRLLATVTWNGTVPVVTMSTGTYVGFDVMADGVYCLNFSTTAVTAANTNTLHAFPATNAALVTTSTGTLIIGGIQAENLASPSSYIPTTTGTVTRSADVLNFPFLNTLVPGHVYCKFAEKGNTNGAGVIRLWGISDNLHTPAFYITFNGSYGTRLTISGNTTTSSLATIPNYNDQAEMHVAMDPTTGSHTMSMAVNGGALVTGNTTGAHPSWPPGAWGQSLVNLGTGNVVAMASLRIGPATTTLAQSQVEIYDSGWLTPWPVGFTAENLVPYNLGAVAIVPSTQTAARYWSCQIDDPNNAAGYIELARLFVGGGYQPSINAEYGAKVGWDSDSAATRSDGGALIHQAKPNWRTAVFTLDAAPTDESLAGSFDLMGLAGTNVQIYFVYDPSDDAAHMLRRAFLATLTKLSALEFAYVDRTTTPFELAEEL